MTKDEELLWLREIVLDLQPLAGRQMDEITQLKAENAKLRDLLMHCQGNLTSLDNYVDNMHRKANER